ncbi:MAG: DNA replication/repair protein RecF [Cyanobacteriota bacterium]|jgi:DNA replication and repair protein RecF|nr:DNA replication/repair protein RecF [Cyanobacteriota bacterium]
MRLQSLELRQFRNIQSLRLVLAEPRLIVVGANGEGKSNLLEGVELLTSLRSHRCGSDRDLIRRGQSDSHIRGLTSEGDGLELVLRRVGGRQALRNGKTLTRQVDLLGSLRCVGFSALDLALVRGEPGLRRQWLDRVVMQLEPMYGALLSQYGRLLRQRAHLLRRHLANGALLDVFDGQMAVLGTRLHRRRLRALQRLAPLANAWQERLGGGAEALELAYRSGTPLADGVATLRLADAPVEEATWRTALEAGLRAQRGDEERLGQCLVGPQRDEVEMRFGDLAARRYGSSGQQRTLVLALKLAELELVTAVVGAPPLLLLDDVLAELDPTRQQLLLEAVGEGHQCLVSATHVEMFSRGWSRRAQVVTMRSGALEGAH